MAKNIAKSKRETAARVITPIVGVGAGAGVGYGMTTGVASNVVESTHMEIWLTLVVAIIFGLLAYAIYHFVAKHVDKKRDDRLTIDKAKIAQGDVDLLEKDEIKLAKKQLKEAQANLNRLGFKVRKSEEVSKRVSKLDTYDTSK